MHDLGILPRRPGGGPHRARGRGRAHHVVLTSGGASRGDEDHVVRSVAALGRLDFWQIAMKPGRPLGLGRIGAPVFVALPGNPVATLVCFLLFARPVLLRLAGATWTEPRRVPLPAGFAPAQAARPQPSTCAAGSRPRRDGRLLARRIEREGSGILTSMSEADGLIEVAEDRTEVREGDPVPFLGFAELGLEA